jgi:ATP synthase subunit 6
MFFFLYQPLSQFEATLYANSVLSYNPEIFTVYYCLYIFSDFFYHFYNYYDLDFVFTWYYFNHESLIKQEKTLQYFGYILYYFVQIIIFKIIYFVSLFFFSTDFLNRHLFICIPVVFIRLVRNEIDPDDMDLMYCIYDDEEMFLKYLKENYLEEVWIDTSINKFHVTSLFIFLFFLLFFVFCFKNLRLYNVSWHFVLFSLIDDFLSNTIIQQLGIKRGQKYSIFLKTFFFLILFSNIFGLIPFSFTITSHLIFTFSLSLSLLIAITALGFYKQGNSFFNLLVPSGAPKFLLPLLVPIEFISYIARCFSLAIRLFANMMSGHTLLNILSGFILKISKNGFLFFSLAPLVVVLAVTVLELGIAFLQAYVFLVLVCIYLKDAFEVSH